MPKYRNLLPEELQTFEKEFVNYLVVNGITADDWVKLKADEKDKAEKIIELFSDVILEGVLRKIQFLEIRTKGYVHAIQCLPEKMLMVSISCKDKKYNMSDFNADSPKRVVGDYFEMHRGEKAYDESREKNIFDMTEKGYAVSDGGLYKSLLLSLV